MKTFFIGCLISVMLLPFSGRAEPPGAAQVKAAPPLFETADRCVACHNGLETPSGEDVSIGTAWRTTMMANASVDPYWQASVRREALDHAMAKAHIQDECTACHMPMARFQARADGRTGALFVHLPLAQGAAGYMDRLAADAVSCTICHQIRADKLGTDESFTAGFVVDARTPPGERTVFGPFDIDAGRARVMQSSALFRPDRSKHIQESALCGSCHTLYTNALGPGGENLGRLPRTDAFSGMAAQ